MAEAGCPLPSADREKHDLSEDRRWRRKDTAQASGIPQEMTFHVGTEEIAEGTFVVAVDGELDLYTAPDLDAALLGVLGAGGRRIVVDLALTTFIDSVALGTLVRAAKELQRERRLLAVVCGPDVGHFFEVAGLDRFFELEPTREAALARLARQAR